MEKLFFNKYKISSACLLITISTIVSCKKLIEIPPNPSTQITKGEQFADSTTTLSAVAGVYTYTSGQGFPYGDANLTITTALSANEITGGYGDQPEFYSYTLTPINSEITSLWASPYQGIYQVNDIISGINNNPNLSASFIKQITGEMEVTRALYYFNMVNLFGGVPLVTSIDYKTTANLPRATVVAIYNQISTDLTDAVKKLPASYPSNGRARPNLYSAQALLAKVHLYQGKWQAAYNEADSIINSGLYTLTPNLNAVFLDGSNEAIWQLPVLNSYSGTAEASNFVPYSSGVTPNFVVTDSLRNQFETGDLRLANWLHSTVVGNQTLYYPYKYQDLYKTSPSTDFMIFRLGEIYLIRAEAAAELNNLKGALADINIIRARAGLGASTTSSTSQSTVLAAIAKERRTELCFEWGNRWFDLNRTGKASIALTGYQSYDGLYPLPQVQIQLNSQLIQNPGYH